MKDFLIRQLQSILKWLAQAIIAKYHPRVIAITGSVGKTSAKEAVYAALKDTANVRRSRGNFNNELGAPLAILGDWKKIEGVFFWLKVVVRGFWNIVQKTAYPEILVLEYGVQKPGDMRYLLEIAKPVVSIVTAMGEVPAHLEFFKSAEDLIREKARLVEAVLANGVVILNADDKNVLAMKERTRAHVMTVGTKANADVRVTSVVNQELEDGRPVGVTFKLEYRRNSVSVRLMGVLGKSHAYAAAFGVAAGLSLGGNLAQLASSVEKNYVPAKHRMAIVRGANGANLIDDTYNASPLSMRAALDVVKSLKPKRAVGVLGDMLELGGASDEAHASIGEYAGKVLDVLVTVGEKARIIAEHSGLAKKNIVSVSVAKDAVPVIKNLLKSGDLVLIKASRGIGLDTVVDALRESAKS
ncbi:MAG: UDP-N-acetylmuramoyl-tripeptide--D-alanyl-D-alanine ligase [bacterium]|nr:UDP-N-acetylmuramoyl-tripeptide--D-alanyl-D-alanine ligase [bacterium]